MARGIYKFNESMTVSEQIQELNETVKCHIKSSPIDGIGVFALRDIKKGEKCFAIPEETKKCYSITSDRFNELRPEVAEFIKTRWPSVILGSLFISPNDMVWLITYMNHSDQPNFNVDTDSALRDIREGEELTENYKLMKNWWLVYPWLK